MATAFTPKRPSKCAACLSGCASVLNTVVLILILLIVAHTSYKVHHELKKVERITNVLTGVAEDPAMAHNLAKFLGSTAGAFFFGTSDGAIPTFFADSIFGFDFTSFGTAILNFATEVGNVMANAPPSNSCNQFVTCNYEGPLTCANGAQVWCNAPGDRVNCALDSCIAPYISAGASLVESVASLVAKVEPVPVSNSSAVPAFSDGLLRVDQLLKWVEAQADPSAWQSAAKACQLFTFRVKAINWIGAWVDANGNTRSWNANSQIRQVAGYFDQICDPLAQLNTEAAKKKPAQDKKH